MTILRKLLIAFAVFLVLVGGFAFWVYRGDSADLTVDAVTGTDPTLSEAKPQMFPTVRIAEPIGWKDGELPEAAEGLSVSRFADGLDHPRVIHTLPNGDVLVTLTRAPKSGDGGGIMGWIADKLMARAGATGESPNQLVLLRDADGNGAAEVRQVLTDALDSPSGIAWNDGTLYVANHDEVLAFDYALGDTSLTGAGRKLMDLPPGGGHWMRNLELSPDGKKLYVAVGSVSNIGEKGMAIEENRAMIHELDLASGESRPYAAGLRNPNGLAFSPWSGELWTTVNERDMLGSDMVPDYLTNVPIGAQYGWPWLYWGDTIDERVEEPMPQYLTEYTRRPEYALGPHVAALGMVFSSEGDRMGSTFGQGAFIARHGSWNRKPPSGYDLIYVPFDARGNPQGKPVVVLTGFLTGDGTTRGRPTWVEWAGDGALLLSDDTAGIIWRVVAKGAEPRPAIERQRTRSMPPQRELSGNPTASFREDPR